MSKFRNLGFEARELGQSGDADFWVIDNMSSVETLAGYLTTGGNYALHSEDWEDAVWATNFGSVGPGFEQGPLSLGAPQANRFRDNLAAGTVHQVYQDCTVPAGATQLTFSMWARKIPAAIADWCYLQLSSAAAGVTAQCFFDMVNGEIGEGGPQIVVGSAAEPTVSIEQFVTTVFTHDWYRLVISLVLPTGTDWTTTRILFGSSQADGDTTYDGDADIDGVFGVYGGQLNIGALAPYRVTTAAVVEGVQPVEDFESRWENDGFVFSFDDDATTVAQYAQLNPPVEQAFEGFENQWDTNEAYSFVLGLVTSAGYDGENFDGFEGWGLQFDDLDAVNTGPNEIICIGTTFVLDERVALRDATAGADIPAGLFPNLIYYVLDGGSDTTRLALTMGGTEVDITSVPGGPTVDVFFLDRNNYLFDWADVLAGAGVTTAGYSGEVGAATEAFENFETEWGLGLSELVSPDHTTEVFNLDAVPTRSHVVDEPVSFENLGGQTLPAGFAFNTTYYVRGGSPDSRSAYLSLGATPGGAVITFVDNGTGGPFKLRMLGGNFHYLTDFAISTQISNAIYDTTLDDFEDFEAEWPTVFMTTV